MSLFLFALILSICSTLMDQLWIRKQNQLAWRWGVTDYYEVEEQRGQFRGIYQHDIITGKRKKINETSGTYKNCLGGIVTMFFVSLVLVSAVGLTLYKAQLILTHESQLAQLIGVANAIQIKILNFVRTI